MAYYVRDRRYLYDEHGKVKGEILDIFMDSAADVGGLPGIDKILPASTALDMSTGDSYALGNAGWRML